MVVRVYGDYQWAGEEVVTTAKSTPNHDGTNAYAMVVSDPNTVAAIMSLAASSGQLIVSPAGTTLTVGQSGSIITNEGASAIAPFVLPTATAGLRYSFIVQDADGIRVTAGAGDTIQIGSTVSATAGKIESTTLGSAITLVAINAVQWVATSSVGTWVVT